jgi:hypothetical protein
LVDRAHERHAVAAAELVHALPESRCPVDALSGSMGEEPAVPASVARSIAGSESPPIISGSDAGSASGRRWPPRACQNLPEYVTDSSVHRRRNRSICSSIRLPRTRKSAPLASNSASFQPTPTPSRIRPRLRDVRDGRLLGDQDRE